MEKFGELMGYLVEFFKREYLIYGYEISFWEIFMFTMVGGIIFGFIGGFFNDK